MLRRYLLRTLELAGVRRGFCAPNPAVGAVVVRDGEIVGEGFHYQAGYPHAEVEALKALGERAQGATLYVSLEPCCHYGKTPPCTELIKQHQLAKVYYAYRDPNPKVAGGGQKALQQAGMDCEYIALPEADCFYQSYAHWIANKKPWVSAKIALSQDQKIAAPEGKPVKITGDACWQFTHQQRLHADAILTTAETILHDDPQLNARLNNEVSAKPVYILDSRLRMPFNAKVLTSAQEIILFHAPNASEACLAAWRRVGIRCVAIAHNGMGLDLTAILDVIGQDGVHDLWLEAGGRCFQAMLQHGLAQQAFVYVASQVLGEMATTAFSNDFAWDKLAGYQYTQVQCGHDVVYHLLKSKALSTLI